MSTTVLQARAVIDADDHASKTLAAIQKRMDALMKSTTNFNKALGAGGSKVQFKAGPNNIKQISSALRIQTAAASSAAAAIDKLGSAFARAAIDGRRLTSTAYKMAGALHAVAAAGKGAHSAVPGGLIHTPDAGASYAPPQRRRKGAPSAVPGGLIHPPGAGVSYVPPQRHRKGYGGGVSMGIGNGMRAGFGFGGEGLLGTLKELAVSSAVIHVAHGVFEGLKDMNNQRQSAIQQGMSPQEIDRATKFANYEASKFKSTSVASNFETYLETAAISHDEPTRQAVVDLFARRAQLASNAGRSETEVRGGQMQFMKAMDTLGMFTPNEKTGQVDTDRMKKYFEASMQVQGVEKGNLPDSMIQQTAKYLKSTGMAITVEGWKRALFYAAEAGSSGANEANRMMTTFSGSAKKETLPQLIADGFMEAGGQRRGKKGKPGAYYGLRPADEDAANADPRAWAVDHVMAAMKKRGLDVNDKNEVVKYIRSLQTNQLTANFLIKAVTQRLEAERQLEQANRVKVDEKAAQDGQAGSINAAMAAIENRIKDLGAASDDKGGNFVAAGLNHVAERIDALNQFIRNPNEKTGADLGQTAGEIAAIVIAKAGFDKLMDKGGLFGAGAALTGSAGELSLAATALDAAAAKLGAANLPGIPKGLPPVAPIVPLAPLAGAGPAAAIAAVPLVGIAGAAVGAGYIMDKFHADAPGHRPWTAGRLWRNFTTGGDDMPTASEIGGPVPPPQVFHPKETVPDMASLLSGRITAKVDGPIPVQGTGELTLTLNINASPELKADLASAKRSISLVLKSAGQGPTGHSFGSLGPSMPEAAPDAATK